MADRKNVVYGLKCITGKLDPVPAVICPVCHYTGSGEDFDSCVMAIAEDALELLKEQEPVVRCKDCKNWVGNGADIDELPYWLPCKGEMRRPDYFCADGERR